MQPLITVGGGKSEWETRHPRPGFSDSSAGVHSPPMGLTCQFSVQYTDYVRYVEPCFRGTLVQADLDNREVRPLSCPGLQGARLISQGEANQPGISGYSSHTSSLLAQEKPCGISPLTYFSTLSATCSLHDLALLLRGLVGMVLSVRMY